MFKARLLDRDSEDALFVIREERSKFEAVDGEWFRLIRWSYLRQWWVCRYLSSAARKRELGMTGF